MAVSSECFRAYLGNLDEPTEARLDRWAAENCVRHKLARLPDGCLALWAQRGEARSSKSSRVCIRTVFSNWETPLVDLPSDWLVLLTRAEFEEEATATQPPCPETTPPCPMPYRDAAATPLEAVPRLSLSAGFDERAAAALSKLRMVPCVA